MADEKARVPLKEKFQKVSGFLKKNLIKKPLRLIAVGSLAAGIGTGVVLMTTMDRETSVAPVTTITQVDEAKPYKVRPASHRTHGPQA